MLGDVYRDQSQDDTDAEQPDVERDASHQAEHRRQTELKARPFHVPIMDASSRSGEESRPLSDRRFYGRGEVKIGGAFPGFHDIYQQAGVQPSHGHLAARDGETFRHSLERSLASDSPFIQVATWNDFGEGTCIEPAREYEYVYLEEIQRARRRFPAELFRYHAEDLRLPLRIYQLRKRGHLSSEARRALDGAVELLAAGEGHFARKSVDDLEQLKPRNSSPGDPPR